MDTSNRTEWRTLLRRAAMWDLAVLFLTTVHHVYGAYRYHTLWRLHVAFVSGAAAAALVAAVLVVQRSTRARAATVAFGVFAGITILLPVIGIGLFEGGYNHALKNALYFGGASPALMRQLFPPPAYEMPGDAFFEITGVLQVVPAMLAGWHVYRVARSRSAVGDMSPAI